MLVNLTASYEKQNKIYLQQFKGKKKDIKTI